MNVNNGNILVIYIYFISFKTSLIDNYLACSRDYTVLPTTIILVLDVVLWVVRELQGGSLLFRRDTILKRLHLLLKFSHFL